MAEHNIEFAYITNENTDKSNCAKLFCGFRPDDRIIAKEIMQDVVSVCDCTIFYYENGEPLRSDSNFENDLSQMSVLILVVTSDYLASSSFARDILYPYAVEHMIPVLPIVTDTGLEKPFGRCFGNLQFILWHGEQYDITAVPYLQRLNNYLKQILCMDKSRKEFRDAFDTGLFLSYRKKDRYYAQKLMEMIHADERCQSISIWYDEFLIPGEDFNENIRYELENSSMMILVVTPHITEDNNYIILTEYPAAVEMKKRILPFEMCPTSRLDLGAAYADLPAVVPTEKVQTVQQVILSAAQKLGISHMGSSDEKEYLRGLAYLKGICVEKSIKIGSEKIKAAAQKGVPQAMQTISFMYKNGEGVERSVKEAAFWQEKYIETAVADYSADSTEENALSLIGSYFELGSIYEQWEKRQEAIAVYETIEDLCENKQFEELPAFIDFYVTAKIKAGTLLMQIGDYVTARHCYFEEAVKKCKKQREEAYQIWSKLNLCHLFALISECCENCQDIPNAKSYAIELRKVLDSETSTMVLNSGDFSLLDQLARCKSQLAHLYVRLFDDHCKSFEFVSEALQIAEKTVAVSDCYAAKRQLVLAHIDLGDQYMAPMERNCISAEAAFADADKLLTEMRDKYGFGLELQRINAIIMQKRGFVKLATRDLSAALALYRNAMEQFRSLNIRQDTLISGKDLYDCMTNLGLLYQKQGNDPDDAEHMFLEALKLAQKNIDGDLLAVYKKDAAAIHDYLSALYKAQWDMDKAFSHSRMQIDLLRQVFSGTKRLGDLSSFVSALEKAIKTANLAGEFDTAAEWQRESEDLQQQYPIFFEAIKNMIHI